MLLVGVMRPLFSQPVQSVAVNDCPAEPLGVANESPTVCDAAATVECSTGMREISILEV